jgi:hypothetical protein
MHDAAAREGHTMIEDQKHESGWHAGRWVVWVVALLVVYVLSYAPVSVLTIKYNATLPTNVWINRCYWPVSQLIQHSDFCYRVFFAEVRWFMDVFHVSPLSYKGL